MIPNNAFKKEFKKASTTYSKTSVELPGEVRGISLSNCSHKLFDAFGGQLYLVNKTFWMGSRWGIFPAFHFEIYDRIRRQLQFA